MGSSGDWEQGVMERLEGGSLGARQRGCWEGWKWGPWGAGTGAVEGDGCRVFGVLGQGGIWAGEGGLWGAGAGGDGGVEVGSFGSWGRESLEG